VEGRIGFGVIILLRSAHETNRSNAMSNLKIFGAVAAVLSGAIVTPVSAQAVIQEPGYCAFFYPNANCQNKGPGNPYGNYQQPNGQYAGWPPGETVGVVGRRSRTHRSDSSTTRTQ
jgi:hypothetical protein